MRKIITSVIRSIGRGIRHDPEIKRLIERHPIVSGFIKRRLTPDEAFGLHLTVGSLLTLFFVFFFFGIFKQAIGEASVTESDIRILNFIQIFRTPSFTTAMLFFTTLGKWQVIFLGTAAASVIFIMRQRWYNLTTLLVSVIVGELFVWVIKNSIERPRPSLVNALTPEVGFSFPSGHAFVAFSFYGLLAYFFFYAVKKIWLRVIIFLSACILIGLIGFSRVYLGVHWPSDVVASMFSGCAWLTILITVLEIRRKTRTFPPMTKFRPLIVRLTIAGLFLIWLLSTVYFFKAYTVFPDSPVSAETPPVLHEQKISDEFFSTESRYSETVFGTKTEPINFLFIGEQEDISRMMKKAGWTLSETISFGSFQKLVYAALFDTPYLQAPGTPTFWNTQPNDFSYGKPTEANSIRERHHIHIWVTPYSTDTGKHLFVATAHFDVGIKFRSWFIIPIHKIDPAIDKEREQIKKDLLATGFVEKIQDFQIVEPILGKNLGGDQFFTDGKAYSVFLKKDEIKK